MIDHVTPARAGARRRRSRSLVRVAVATGMTFASIALAEDATFATRNLTPDTALKVAQVAMQKCRAEGFQVSVAVVDRSGVTQVVLRDRFAPPHSPDTAQR